MSIYGSVCTQLEKYGEKVTITTEDGTFSTMAIVEPLLYKNKLYLRGKQLPQGCFDNGNYLMIGQPDVKLPVTGAAFVETKDRIFFLVKSETVNLEAKPVYVWAVLEPYVKPEEDVYEN